MEPIIKIENITKSFGDLQVLKDISFEVFPGDVLSIIGASGGGKSTILRCVTHLETVTSGSIMIDGDYLVKNGVYAPKRELNAICLKIGLAFQNYNLFPHFSVLRNITEAPIHVAGVPRAQAEAEALKLLKDIGLESKASSYPFQLSGGQQQRVAIARALAMKPKVLFFDEPTSALDPELTQEVLKIIRDLAKNHTTMVIVTHEMNFAAEVSNKIIFIDEGLIVEEGTPQEVIYSPTAKRTQEFLSHRK